MEFIKEAGVSPQKSMDIKNDKITIKPLRDKDVDIFSKWLAKEYIYKWFCPDGEEHKMAWLDEVNNRNTQYHYMKHFIVYYNDKAIGFCLYLDCYFEKEYIPEHYGKTVDEKETVFEIGYLIGEEEYLGKGIGKIIVKKLIGECEQYYSPAVAISAGLWYNITKESAVWQTVSTFPVGQLQRMTAQVCDAGAVIFCY